MKIRFGFVSNSSTTSFCIYGKYFNRLPENDEDWYDVCDEIGLECHSDPYGRDHYIGLSLTDIGLDETFREFQNRTKEKFEKIGLDTEKMGIYKTGWYDG